MLNQVLRNRYKIISQIGKGIDHKTYLALDLELPGSPKRVVKSISLTEKEFKDTELLTHAQKLFYGEAKSLSMLQHQQIPKIYDYFVEEKQKQYIVQEYIEGHGLNQEIQPNLIWSEQKTIHFLKDILAILVFVHENKVIHRDIKPSNIMRRENGELVLIDFGSVKLPPIWQLENKEKKTYTNTGTPGYVPSEQSQGTPKLASDIYAVGIIAIQALTGLKAKEIFDNRDSETNEIIWCNKIKVSKKLVNIINKMVRYDYRQRYQKAKEVLEEIEVFEKIKQESHTHPVEDTYWQKVALALLPIFLLSLSSAIAIRYLLLKEKLIQAINPNQTSVQQQNQNQAISKQVLNKEISLTKAVSEKAVNEKLEFSYNPTLSKVLSKTDVMAKSIAINSDNKIIAIGGKKGIAIFNLNNFRLHKLDYQDINALAMDSDQLIAGTASGKILIFNLSENPELIQEINVSSYEILSLSVSPDGKIAAGIKNGVIKILSNLNSPEQMTTLLGHYGNVNALTWNKNQLQSASNDRTIKIWNIDDKSYEQIVDDSAVFSLLVADNSIISGNKNGTIRVWSSLNYSELDTFKWDTGKIYGLAKYRNFIISSSNDRTIKIWNRNKRQHHTLNPPHKSDVSAIAITNNGKFLISADQKEIKVWQRKK